MTKDQLKAKYGRIANDDSQLTAFKDDLIDGEIPVNDARIPQPEAADTNKLLIVDDEDNFVLSSVANAIGGTVQEMIADKADLVGGKVPSTQLPSYVDDVVEYASLSNFPAEGEQGKIYLALDTGLCYRWSGSEYIQIAGSTSVLMFASQANFPAEGEEGVIYVAEDTNKQFRWNGSAYVELSTADCIEVVEYQTTTPLTDEQVAKAEQGKLAVYQSQAGVIMTAASYNSSSITFRATVLRDMGAAGAYFETVDKYYDTFCTLSRSTKKFDGYYNNLRNNILDNTTNVISETTIPATDSKRIIRALNLRKTQDMIADVYDATATYKVGDVVIYNNYLYQCIVKISTAEAWTSAHWNQVTAVTVNDIVTVPGTSTLSSQLAARVKTAKAIYFNGYLSDGRQHTVVLQKVYDSDVSVEFSAIEFNLNSMSIRELRDYHASLNPSSNYFSINVTTRSYVESIGGWGGKFVLDSSIQRTGSGPSFTLGLTGKLPYLTTAPTADNASGFISIVVLDAEPATRYNGYLYIITASAQ